jgi:hypothetical protein
MIQDEKIKNSACFLSERVQKVKVIREACSTLLSQQLARKSTTQDSRLAVMIWSGNLSFYVYFTARSNVLPVKKVTHSKKC